MTGRPYGELKERNRLLSRLDLEERPEACRALPVKVTLNTTHKCNIHCPLCFKQFEPGHNMSYPDMPFQVYEEVARDLFPAADEAALSVSGEPLVSPHIAGELALASEYGVHVAITTNGVPLGSPGIRELVLRHVHTVHLSMDAATPETFERIRAGARWEQVLGALGSLLRERAARGGGPRIYANFVMMRENIEELPAWVELLAGLGADGGCAEHVVVPEPFAVQSLTRHRALAAAKMGEARAAAARLGLLLRLPPPFPPDPAAEAAPRVGREEARAIVAAGGERPAASPGPARLPSPEEIRAWNGRILPGRPVPCPYAWRELWIHHDGGILCCDTPTFPHRMGVVPADRASEVWNGERWRELRRRLRAGDVYAACRHCHVMGQIDAPEDPLSFVKGV